MDVLRILGLGQRILLRFLARHNFAAVDRFNRVVSMALGGHLNLGPLPNLRRRRNYGSLRWASNCLRLAALKQRPDVLSLIDQYECSASIWRANKQANTDAVLRGLHG